VSFEASHPFGALRAEADGFEVGRRSSCASIGGRTVGGWPCSSNNPGPCASVTSLADARHKTVGSRRTLSDAIRLAVQPTREVEEGCKAWGVLKSSSIAVSKRAR